MGKCVWGCPQALEVQVLLKSIFLKAPQIKRKPLPFRVLFGKLEFSIFSLWPGRLSSLEWLDVCEKWKAVQGDTAREGSPTPRGPQARCSVRYDSLVKNPFSFCARCHQNRAACDLSIPDCLPDLWPRRFWREARTLDGRRRQRSHGCPWARPVIFRRLRKKQMLIPVPVPTFLSFIGCLFLQASRKNFLTFLPDITKSSEPL